MKVHKVELYIVDFDEVGGQNIREIIENVSYPNRCISPNVVEIQTRDIGPWDDEHPLNKRATATEEYRRIFKEARP